MKKILLSLYIISFVFTTTAQTSASLNKAVNQLLQDPQMKHALLGFYVINNNTGQVVCNVNGAVGMSPASAQKIVTAATAFELLGEKFQYATSISYNGKIVNNTLPDNLYIIGSGDPTLGSDRYSNTQSQKVLQQITTALQQNNIRQINGQIIMNGSIFNYQPTPSGWTWGDIGNYYGAGVWGINWCENKFDIFLKSGDKEGDSVSIINTKPDINIPLTSFVKSGPKGSGDNSYVYLPPFGNQGFIEGTIPAGEKSFKVSGALPDPEIVFSEALKKVLQQNNIEISEKLIVDIPGINNLCTIYSPTLDSIVYWFLQKSINLYGEAFVKTLAASQKKVGSTPDGIKIIRDFWQDIGIETSSLKMIDGSGLSPQNKVTPQALVQVLQYAKQRPWFNSFYNALPTYNNMKMKSGTMSSIKAFAGYHKNYTFAIIINNFDGTSSSITSKIYELLNEL